MRRAAIYTVILLYLCSLVQTEAARLGHGLWHSAEQLISTAASHVSHQFSHLHGHAHSHHPAPRAGAAHTHDHPSDHRHPVLVEWLLGQESADRPQALPESGGSKFQKQTPQERSETCPIPLNPERKGSRIRPRQEQLPAAPCLPVPEPPPRSAA